MDGSVFNMDGGGVEGEKMHKMGKASLYSLPRGWLFDTRLSNDDLFTSNSSFSYVICDL